MLVLTMGGSGSGKSAFAEKRCMELAAGNEVCYLATMRVYDEEGRQKVQRHRQLRAQKSFFTVEMPEQIDKALQHPKLAQKRCGLLLECMSNLVANEMFCGKQPDSAEAVAQRVLSGVKQLEAALPWIVVVTNNVFEDGIAYDHTTMEYMRALGMVNCALAEVSDETTELVAGIPLVLRSAGDLYSAKKGECLCGL